MAYRFADRIALEDEIPDVGTILENVVQLDELLDEGSRRELDALPYLELSKHLRIRKS